LLPSIVNHVENCVILEFVSHVENCVILGFVQHVENYVICHFRVCCVGLKEGYTINSKYFNVDNVISLKLRMALMDIHAFYVKWGPFNNVHGVMWVYTC